MKIFEHFDLTPFNSYRLKAKCARAIFPESERDLIEIFKVTDAERRFVIGSGHNLILSCSYYDETFIIFSNTFDQCTIEGNIIKGESGITMLRLSELALKNELTGLEIFYDIPSSLGGAVVMNAGASGEEIKDVLVKARYFDPKDGSFAEIEKKDMGFEYRNSFFQKNPHLIITSAWLKMTSGNYGSIYEKMKEVKAARWAKQPRDWPNAGSVFKRPPGHFVGPMIDELGLKGYTVGGAKISEKHGGFIINYNNATGADILNIVDHVKEQVLKNFGIDLEIEQRIL